MSSCANRWLLQLAPGSRGSFLGLSFDIGRVDFRFWLRLGSHTKNDLADHRFGLARDLGRNRQEPASRHRERRHEGVHARFRADQWNERRVHFGPSIVSHDNAHLDDYCVGDSPSAGLVEQPHGDGSHVARFDLGLDGLEHVVVCPSQYDIGQGHEDRYRSASENNFPRYYLKQH